MIERPLPLPRNQGRGTETPYVSGTGYGLIGLLAFRKTARTPFHEWAWAALTQGHAFPYGYWLSRVNDTENTIAQVGQELGVRHDPGEDGPSLSEDAPEIISGVSKRRSQNPVEGEMRRRLGKERFAEFVRMFIEVAFGAYRSAETIAIYDTEDAEGIYRILGRGFGIDPPEKKKSADATDNDPCTVHARELDSILAQMSTAIAAQEAYQPSKKREREAHLAPIKLLWLILAEREAHSAAVELLCLVLRLTSIEQVQRQIDKKSSPALAPLTRIATAVELLCLILRLTSIEQAQRQIDKKNSPALALLTRIAAQLDERSFFVSVAIWMRIRRIPHIGNGVRQFLACDEPDFSNSFGSNGYSPPLSIRGIYGEITGG